MWEQRLGDPSGARPIGRVKRCEFTRDLVGSQLGKHIELRLARRVGAPVRKIDNLSLCCTLDRRMRIIDKTGQPFGQPMISPRLSALAIHPLLHDGPPAVVGYDEAVQVEVETILYGGAVDLGNEAT